MKKVYILLMGLMTSLCLMTTSCSSQEEDGITTTDSEQVVLPRGDFKGCWYVNGWQADSCVMTSDGHSFIFSKLPIKTIIQEARIDLYPDPNEKVGASANYNEYNEYKEREIEVNEYGRFGLIPVPTGYSENGIYFSNSYKKETYVEAHKGLKDYTNEDLLRADYVFSATDGEKTWYYGLVFSEDNYGMVSKEQSSRAILLFLKEVIYYWQPDNLVMKHECKPVITLKFISKDL